MKTNSLLRLATLVLLSGCYVKPGTAGPEDAGSDTVGAMPGEGGTSSPSDPEHAPEVEPHPDAIRFLEVEKAASARREKSTSDGLPANVITLTNNEEEPVKFGTLDPMRSNRLRGFRTARLARVTLVWIGSAENVWRVKGGTRYIVYEKQGNLSLAVWDRE